MSSVKIGLRGSRWILGSLLCRMNSNISTRGKLFPLRNHKAILVGWVLFSPALLSTPGTVIQLSTLMKPNCRANEISQICISTPIIRKNLCLRSRGGANSNQRIILIWLLIQPKREKLRLTCPIIIWIQDLKQCSYPQRLCIRHKCKLLGTKESVLILLKLRMLLKLIFIIRCRTQAKIPTIIPN